MKKQQGFTLIELVIVIVVLAILAAFALPKFINLSSDARLASLRAMEGAMRSGANIIHSEAALNNQDVGENTLSVDGINISLHSGYPIGNWMNGIRYVVNLDTVVYSPSGSVCEADWCGRGNQFSIPSGNITSLPGRVGKVYPRGYSWGDECGVYYANHANGDKAEIGLETKDCK